MNEAVYKRLTEINDELHDIANSFAGNATGIIAVELHEAGMKVASAQRMMKTGPTVEDSDQQADDWCDRQAIPMPEETRDLIKFLLRK